jgi:predicted DNA-binding transcriptional regulator YafY
VRRADRLFRIVQRLRRRSTVTATVLAAELEVSLRTVYRDVQDLVVSGVPIRGEAGVGYTLAKGFDLPPLMFNEEEIEALVLGARIVESRGDAALAAAARDVLTKVEAVLPARLKENLADAPLFALGFRRRPGVDHLRALRGAIRDRRKISFGYRDRADAATARTVQPLGVFYWGDVWSLGAWCELREGFRNFRLDRMNDLAVLEQVFVSAPGRTLRDFFRHCEAEVEAARSR